MFLLRSFIYLLCLAGVAHLIQLEGFELKQDALYSEETLTEHMQDVLTFLSCILFFTLRELTFNSKYRLYY
ncbi:hypothetical protein PH505_ae00500 [Pseudoalteromonas distincta]|nr:hypothetical protein PH505_ae00500 [Pseudoalteromonas distincta]